MAQAIEKQHFAAVGHRLHFFGRPQGDTVSWNYQTQLWPIVRPDDGSPPRDESVTCEVCGKQLTYTVYSVSSAIQRRTRWRPVWIGGLLLVPVSFVLLIAGGGGDLAVATVFVGLIAGMFALIFGLQIASAEMGITGHGAMWPGGTKHNVMLDGSQTLSFFM
jgi:hypothetical protein